MNFPNLLKTDEDFFESYGKHINSTYPNFLRKFGLDRVAIKAEGATIIDSAGKTYIDCIGGYGLFNIGHNHPKVIEALIDQISKKQLFSKPFFTDIQVRLAEKLKEITPDELCCSFVCNSGSEAIDTAIKLSRLYKRKKEIITAINSFHGYTFGALSATGIISFKKMFEPMVPGILHVPFGDIDALEKSITPDTAAILLETIQHEAGVVLPDREYLREVRRLSDKNDIIMILDEIKMGFGKTGRMFAFEHYDVVPDLLVLGKSMGGGMMPVGALIGKEKLWKKFSLSFPMSASSFAGNTLTCCCALTTIQIVHEENIIKNCEEKGERLLNKLKKYIRKYPNILKSVDGIGLLLGIETDQPRKAVELAKEMIRKKVLVATAFGKPSTLMIEPPLIITNEQIRSVLRSLGDACEKLN